MFICSFRKYKSSIMVKWNPSWLFLKDANEAVIGDWCHANTTSTAMCVFDSSEIDFSTQGFYALVQHSKTKKHKDVHDAKYEDNTNMKLVSSCTKIAPKPPSSSVSSYFVKPGLNLGLPLSDRILNAEVYWMLKVASSDYSLRSCDNICQLFQLMFDCDVTRSNDFTMARTKASYVISDGLGPYFLKQLVADVKKSESAFTIMYDETTNAKNQKQMDILIRYWSEETNKVETKYLTSLMFARASAEKLNEMLMGLQNDEILSALPWERFCNISSDGPNINKKLWRLLDQELSKEGGHGLMPLIVCNIHTVHNGFKKGINIYGQQCEQLCFDLHAWFKQSPCKEEDFRTLSEDIFIDDESLFLRHVNTRWLTLVPALERVSKRWEDAKKYFLTFLPFNKEYKRHLPNNQKFQRIQSALKNELTSLLQITFLKNIAPIFTKFLTMFQTDGPMIHLMHHELKTLLSTTMTRFVKNDVIAKKSGKQLLQIDTSKEENLMPLNKMDVGDQVRSLLKKCSVGKQNEHLKNMQSAFVAITTYFQEKLPLDSALLNDLMCLNPLLRYKSPSDHICRIARHIPHVISNDSISLLRDEWSLYQNDDEIQESWFVENGSFKRLDHYFLKVFELKTPSGSPRYQHLRKVVKTCCSLQNGNAPVERSLSDNKNTVTKEQTQLSDTTIEGLRRSKEFTRSSGGAHTVSVTPAMRGAVRNAHSNMKKRQEEEKLEKEKKRRKEKEAEEETRRMKEQLEKAEKSKGKLEEKEAMLAADEADVDQSLVVTEKLLKEGQIRLTKAIASKDFTEVELASSMIDSANKKLEEIRKHREEQQKIKSNICKKRGSIMDFLLQSKKKKLS